MISQHAEHHGHFADHLAVWEGFDELLTELARLVNAFQGRIDGDQAVHALVPLRELLEIVDDDLKGENGLPQTRGIGGGAVLFGRTHFIVTATEAIVERGIVVRTLLDLAHDFLVGLELGFDLILADTGDFLELGFQFGHLVILDTGDFRLLAHELVGTERFFIRLLFHHLIAELEIDVVHLSNAVAAGGKVAHLFHQRGGFIELAAADVNIGRQHRCLDGFCTANPPLKYAL